MTKLTNREYDILKILWTSEDALTASGISEQGDGISINTVQATLKKLLKRDLIHVDQIVYSGTVLSRAYRPSVSQEDFELKRYVSNMKTNPGKRLFLLPVRRQLPWTGKQPPERYGRKSISSNCFWHRKNRNF